MNLWAMKEYRDIIPIPLIQLKQILLQQIRRHEAYFYTHINDQKLEKLSYPTHLGATTLALQALYQSQREHNNPELLAHYCKHLITSQEKDGGPYNSWIHSPFSEGRLSDIDLSINCHINDFLCAHNVRLPQLNKYIRVMIHKRRFHSSFYASQAVVWYAIANSIPHELKESCIEYIIEEQNEDGYWNNALDTALAICALRNLNVPPHRIARAYEYLVSHIEEKRTHEFPFIKDTIMSDQFFTLGSQCLSLSFIARALHTYEDRTEKRETRNHLTTLITKEIRNTFFEFPDQIRSDALEELKRFNTSKFSTLICLTPFAIYNSIQRPHHEIEMSFEYKTHHHELTHLSTLHALGWITYSLIDRIVDTQQEYEKLPLCMILLRTLIVQAYEYSPHSISISTSILDQLDDAVAWELKHAKFPFDSHHVYINRLPEYGRYAHLARKSAGLTISPLLALFLTGKTSTSVECVSLRLFYHSYLIARQLHDDAQDWLEDLKNGYVNSVARLIIDDWMIKNEQSLPLSLNFDKDTSSLKEIFWNKTSRHVLQKISQHIEKARNAASAISTDTSFYENLLIPLEKSTDRVKQQQKDVRDYIRIFFS